jgi:predicted outer membrane repeat protein
MRVSLASALALAACLGCGSGGTTAGSGGTGGDQSSGGSGGAATGGTTGGGGHATGGSGGPATGGTLGGSTGGASGGAPGGSTGGAAGHGSGGATGGAAGHGSGGATGGAAGHGSGGATGGAAGHGTGGTAGHPAGGGGATGTGGTTRDAGTTVNDGGIGPAGNPNGSCSAGIPTGGQPVDVSSPTTVVGTGTPASCTFSALNAAVAKAGIITFNCGSAAVTIPVTATMTLLINKSTTIDGGNKITLDGGHAVQIFNFPGTNYQVNENRVTLQHLALVNGKTTPKDMIPAQPSMPLCSQGYDDGEGGAIKVNDGNLTVIDCVFTGNQAAQLGPDTGGGAIYVEGSKHGALIVGSTFTNNSGSNAGAVGVLQSELDIYNSLFENNTATGHDANSQDPTMAMCTQMNNGQYEVGSGGNGGAICADGVSFNVTVCGDAVLDNAAGTNAFGGGLFFTSDDWKGILTIADTTMTGNTGRSWTQVKQGSVTDVGSAIGVNALSITVTNSTLQK